MGRMTVASSEAGSCDAAQGDGDSRADREGASMEEDSWEMSIGLAMKVVRRRTGGTAT
jgi:hypothetical protein